MRPQLTISLALLALAVPVAVQALPQGWRTPNDAELNDDARLTSSNRYTRAIGDFNGDGTTDSAVLLLREDGSEEGLWVNLSSGPNRRSWLVVESMPRPISARKYPLEMGIATVPPGRVKYMCHDSDPECSYVDPKHRPTIRLRTPAISYFKLESAASMYYWSTRKKRFERVWLSD